MVDEKLIEKLKHADMTINIQVVDFKNLIFAIFYLIDEQIPNLYDIYIYEMQKKYPGLKDRNFLARNYAEFRKALSYQMLSDLLKDFDNNTDVKKEIMNVINDLLKKSLIVEKDVKDLKIVKSEFDVNGCYVYVVPVFK